MYWQPRPEATSESDRVSAYLLTTVGVCFWEKSNMTNGDISWIANYIWGVCDDVLRDLYTRGKYRDVVLPMAVLRWLNVVLEGTN